MARNFRKPTARPARRGVPGWLMLFIGLGLGAGLTWGVHSYLASSERPLSGLRNLFASKLEAPEKPAPKAATPQPATPKPKFDFYTILPEIETVLPSMPAKPAKPAAKPEQETGVKYLLQAGSFSNPADADQLRAKLALAGLEARIEKVAIEGRGEFHRVRLGPYASVHELDSADSRLGKLGIKAIRLKVKKAGA